jgi:hypothetical protein
MAVAGPSQNDTMTVVPRAGAVSEPERYTLRISLDTVVVPT